MVLMFELEKVHFKAKKKMSDCVGIIDRRFVCFCNQTKKAATGIRNTIFTYEENLQAKIRFISR
jgi:hypothetical protein